jgi:hypothetical protein
MILIVVGRGEQGRYGGQPGEAVLYRTSELGLGLLGVSGDTGSAPR